jgi:hypothetical protein
MPPHEILTPGAAPRPDAGPWQDTPEVFVRLGLPGLRRSVAGDPGQNALHPLPHALRNLL